MPAGDKSWPGRLLIQRRGWFTCLLRMTVARIAWMRQLILSVALESSSFRRILLPPPQGLRRRSEAATLRTSPIRCSWALLTALSLTPPAATPTGNLYVCGNTGAEARRFTRFRLPMARCRLRARWLRRWPTRVVAACSGVTDVPNPNQPKAPFRAALRECGRRRCVEPMFWRADAF